MSKGLQGFQKGNKINLGRNLGKKNPEHSKRMMGKGNSFYGKKHTQESKEKSRLAHLGKPNPNKGKKMWDNKPHPKGMLNKKHSEKTKEKIRESLKGEKCYLWKGGISNTKEYIAFYNRKTKANRKELLGSYTLEQWQELKAKYGFMCLCCKCCEPEIKLTVDHIIPITKWKSYIQFHPEIKYQCNDIENIQPLCGSCNSIKGIKIKNYITQMI